MLTLQALLEICARDHDHLCPRQILGVRIGLAGLRAMGHAEPPGDKRLLVIVESDGCFVDGVSAATGCTVGHRTLRVEDYGKAAATVVDVPTGRAVRIASAPDARTKAAAWAPDARQRYAQQLRGYQTMPDDQLLTVVEVQLAAPVATLISQPGLRVTCAQCGEEIINERAILAGGQILCRACAGPAYYRIALAVACHGMPEPAR